MSKTRHGTWALSLLVLASLAACGRREGDVNPSGSLEAEELRVSAAVAGRLVEVRVDEGDSVSKGDTLLALDLSVLRLQRAQSAAGLESLQARGLRLKEQEREVRATLGLATSTLERVKALHAAGSATDQQLDEATTHRAQVEAKLAALAREGEGVQAERGSLEAALAVQDRQLQDAVVTAPSAGRVLERYVQPGEWVGPGTPALLMADMSTLDLRFYLTEGELSQVKPGMPLQALVDAWPDTPFSGTVEWVSSQAEFTPKNAQTRDARAQLVYAVRLRLPNPEGRLLAGMPAEVLLEPTGK